MKRIAVLVCLLLAACSGAGPSAPMSASRGPEPVKQRQRVGMQRAMSVVDRVLAGWDDADPRVIELLGEVPSANLVPGDALPSKSFPTRIPGGWEVDALVSSLHKPFYYRSFKFRLTGPWPDVDVEVVRMSELVAVQDVSDAITSLQQHLSDPIVLPDVPTGGLHYFYLRYAGDKIEGTIDLTLAPKRRLHIQFGVATFDGCGGDSAKPTRVLGERSLYYTSHHKGQVWSQLIWPVARGESVGSYGLTGPFSLRRLTKWAEQMERLRQQELRARPDHPGC
jgi:hypothetical protein